MKTFSLPNGATGFCNEQNEWVCTGSQMGRKDILPDNRQEFVRLRLNRLPFVDGAYDRWGAYWGAPATVWCATGECSEIICYVFVRADTREQAKTKVQAKLPNVRFFR